LVDKDFIEIIKNLRADLDRDFKNILGVTEGGESSSARPSRPPAQAAPAAQPAPSGDESSGGGRLAGF